MTQLKLNIPQGYIGLHGKHQNEAIEEGIKLIDEERQKVQNGLFCSLPSINRAMGKYWRFNSITLIAGPTGHGKSSVLNELEDNFTDLKDIYKGDELKKKGLNTGFNGEVVLIKFCFEMDAYDEVIRNVSKKSKKSYYKLLSSEYNKDKQDYESLSDEEFEYVKGQFNYIKDRPIYYFENSGNINQMVATVNMVQENFPNAKLIITIDHSLLVKKGREKDDKDLIASNALFAMHCKKKYKAMVIILGQLNNNIETPERKDKPAGHYAVLSDIYCGAQLNWACMNVFIITRPELFNITAYGIDKIPTKHLMVIKGCKSRHGAIGQSLTTFVNGNITDRPPNAENISR